MTGTVFIILCTNNTVFKEMSSDGSRDDKKFWQGGMVWLYFRFAHIS